MIRRLIWLLKCPFVVVLIFPFLVAQLFWWLFQWLLTGEEFDDGGPMDWVTEGWRLKLFDWPLDGSE